MGGLMGGGGNTCHPELLLRCWCSCISGRSCVLSCPGSTLPPCPQLARPASQYHSSPSHTQAWERSWEKRSLDRN